MDLPYGTGIRNTLINRAQLEQFRPRLGQGSGLGLTGNQNANETGGIVIFPRNGPSPFAVNYDPAPTTTPAPLPTQCPSITVSEIFGCNGASVQFPGAANFANISVTNVTSNGTATFQNTSTTGTATFNNVNVTGTTNTATFNSTGPVTLANVTGTGSSTFSNLTATGVFYACDGVATATLQSCTGDPIIVKNPLTVQAELNVCSGALRVGTVNGCGTNPISFDSPIKAGDFASNGNATFNTAQFSGAISACNGASFGQLSACGAGALNVTSVLNVCSGINTSTIGGCNNGAISITSQLTSNQPISATSATFSGALNACSTAAGGGLYVNQITACNGTQINVNSPTVIAAPVDPTVSTNQLVLRGAFGASNAITTSPQNAVSYVGISGTPRGGTNYTGSLNGFVVEMTNSSTYGGQDLARMISCVNSAGFTKDNSVFRVGIDGQIYHTPFIGTGSTVEFVLDDATPTTGTAYSQYYGGGRFVVVSSATDTKQDIADLSEAVPLDVFSNVPVKTYAYKADPAAPKLGLLAEDLDAHPVLKHAVARSPDGSVAGYSAHTLTTCLVGHARTVAAELSKLQTVARGHDHSIGRHDAALDSLRAEIDALKALVDVPVQ